MIEPTAEMIAAHETARRAYWRALDHDTGIGGMTAAEHERVAQRQAMAAVLAIVERDYDVRPRVSPPCAGTTARLVGTGVHRCNLRDGHIGPHRSDTAVWEGEL